MTRVASTALAQVFDQMGTLGVLTQILRCLDHGENTIPLHLYNLRIDCCLLKFYERQL